MEIDLKALFVFSKCYIYCNEGQGCEKCFQQFSERIVNQQTVFKCPMRDPEIKETIKILSNALDNYLNNAKESVVSFEEFVRILND